MEEIPQIPPLICRAFLSRMTCAVMGPFCCNPVPKEPIIIKHGIRGSQNKANQRHDTNAGTAEPECSVKKPVALRLEEQCHDTRQNN